jgi:hypothetical protein
MGEKQAGGIMSFEALLKSIPEYVSRLLRLIANPRGFFTAHDPGGDKALTQALMFLFSSTLLAFVLRVPFLGDEKAYWLTATITVVLYTPTAVVLGGVAHVCCRLFGGRGSLTGNVAIFSYFAGVSVLLFALASLAAKGVIKVGLPDQFALYQEYMTLLLSGAPGLGDARFATLDASRELLISMLVLAGGYVLIAAWLVSAWRAFGPWNRLQGWRIAAALVVFLVVGYGVSALLGLAQVAVGVALF